MDVRTSAEISCTLFLRSTAAVLKQKISAAHGNRFYSGPDFQVPIWLHMNANIGITARKTVEGHIKSSKLLSGI